MKIYMDALNYASVFFPYKISSLKELALGFKRIQEFSKRAKDSGLEITVFIDAGQVSQETQRKWEARKVLEIKGKRRLPYGIDLLLSNGFQGCGIPVMYSLEVDNDDLLASMAERDGAGILSRDLDFGKYRNSSFKVYSGFTWNLKDKTGLYLKERKFRNNSFERELLGTNIHVVKDYQSMTLANIIHKKLFKKGGGTLIFKELCTNPQLELRPLRQALYDRLGVVRVTEILPRWVQSSVEWVKEEVECDKTYSCLLHNPLEAFEEFNKGVKPRHVNQEDWEIHRFSVFSMTMEICSLAKDGGKSFYAHFCKYYKIL